MNRNDFEILSPTSKQKTEMKERLMLEAESFRVSDDVAKRSISLEAEEFVEVKSNAKKMRMSGFAVVAAALVCVVSVIAFVVSNNNKVSVLDSAGSETSQSHAESSDLSSVDEDSSGTDNEDRGTLEPYISDMGTFYKTGLLAKGNYSKTENIMIEMEDLYYLDDKVAAKYKITNLSDGAMDIDVALNSEDKNCFDVYINGYSYRSRFTPYGHLAAEFSKKKLLKEETAEVLISVDYDTLLSLGINVVKNFGITFYYGERWPGDEISFKEYRSLNLCIDMYFENLSFNEHEETEISYTQQLANEAVQEKMSYTFLKYVDNLNYEYDGSVKIESAALLKTHNEATGKDHYTIRLMVNNSAICPFRFNTVISKINDQDTMLAGDNLPGGVVPGKSRLILEVSTSSLDVLKKKGIEEINKIQLINIIDGVKEKSHSVDITFSDN